MINRSVPKAEKFFKYHIYSVRYMGIRIMMILLICIAVAWLFIPTHIFAAGLGRIDIDATVSLRIYYTVNEGAPVANNEFQIYRVADMSEYGQFTPTGQFSDGDGRHKYPITFNQPDSKSWMDLADTLSGIVDIYNLSADRREFTDSSGDVIFKDGMKPGLYLVTGKSKNINGRIYTPTPFLVSLPNINIEADGSRSWNYNVVSNPKSTSQESGGSENPASYDYNLVKVWKQDENIAEVDDEGNSRPESVTVHIYHDGILDNTVTLSQSNDWTYNWRGDDGNWTVLETEVPKGYTMTSSREGRNFIVTNTLQPEIDISDDPAPKEGLPDILDNLVPGDSGNSGNPDIDIDDEDVPLSLFEPNLPDNPVNTDLPDVIVPMDAVLPQTGMLQWPVPFLVCTGLLIFTLGWVKVRKAEIKAGNGEDET